jgi:microcystin degradation protein MlrC
MPKRVLFAGLFHDTHTFLNERTTLRDFQMLRGKEMLKCAGDSSPLGGALESASKDGWEVIPTVDYRASPSATVEDEAVERFWWELETSLHPPFDAIYFVLHGAMVSRAMCDVEGEILERLQLTNLHSRRTSNRE